MCGRIYQEEIYTKAANGKVCAPAVLYKVHLSPSCRFVVLEGLEDLINTCIAIIIHKIINKCKLVNDLGQIECHSEPTLIYSSKKINIRILHFQLILSECVDKQKV